MQPPDAIIRILCLVDPHSPMQHNIDPLKVSRLEEGGRSRHLSLLDDFDREWKSPSSSLPSSGAQERS